MPSVTIRPNFNNSYAGPWTQVGGASPEAGLADSSDATYAVNSAAVAADGQMQMGLGDVTIPIMARVTRLQFYVRANQTGGGGQWLDWRVSAGPSQGSFLWGDRDQPLSGIKDFQSPVFSFGPDGMYDPENPFTSPTMTVDSIVDSLFFTLYTRDSEFGGLVGFGNIKVYDMWAVIEYNMPPTSIAPALSPANINTLTTKPTFGWTFADTDGDSQAAFRLVVWNRNDVAPGGGALDAGFAAAIAAPTVPTSGLRYGNIPASFISATTGLRVFPVAGTGVASSGTSIAGDVADYTSAGSYTITKDLVNNSIYRAYLQVADYQQGVYKWTDPNYVEFTEAVQGLPDPVAGDLALTSYDSVNQKVLLTVKGHTNQLGFEEADFFGNIGTWAGAVLSNAAVAYNSGTGQGGTPGRLAFDSVAAGTYSAAQAFADSSEVQVGQTYTAQAWWTAAVNGRSCQVAIAWYNAAGGTISTSTGSAITSSTGSSSSAFVSATAPALAVRAGVKLVVNSAGGAAERQWVDRVALQPTAGFSAWIRGGLLPNQVANVERSSDAGVTWSPIPAGTIALTGAGGQVATLYDLVPPPGKTVIYRMYTSSSYAPYSMKSAASSSTSGQAIVANTKWWLVDPTDQTGQLRVPIQILGDLNSVEEELQGAFRPLGSDRTVVVSDSAPAAEKWSVDAILKNDADHTLFQTLKDRRKTLVLQGDVVDACYWVRFGASSNNRLVNNISRKTAGTRARFRSFELYEVNPPVGVSRLP